MLALRFQVLFLTLASTFYAVFSLYLSIFLTGTVDIYCHESLIFFKTYVSLTYSSGFLQRSFLLSPSYYIFVFDDDPSNKSVWFFDILFERRVFYLSTASELSTMQNIFDGRINRSKFSFS